MHQTSGETLERVMAMELSLHIADRISFRFAGDASKREPLKEVVVPLLKGCQ